MWFYVETAVLRNIAIKIVRSLAAISLRNAGPPLAGLKKCVLILKFPVQESLIRWKCRLFLKAE